MASSSSVAAIGATIVDIIAFAQTIVDRLAFPKSVLMNSSITTTGLIPLIVGSVEKFTPQATLGGLPWTQLQNGTANLLLKDPNGNQTTIAANTTGPAPTATWTVVGPAGQWTRAWQLTDVNGVAQTSQPIAFQVAASP